VEGIIALASCAMQNPSKTWQIGKRWCIGMSPRIKNMFLPTISLNIEYGKEKEKPQKIPRGL
jgi:hypothetical protein